MNKTNYTEINSRGHLIFDGCDTVELAKQYGTPLYVISETAIRSRCRLVKEHFIDKYDNTLALYASKALSNLAIYKIIKEEGLGIDVVSGGELYTAAKAGFPMDKVYFHGNNKTEEEIHLGIDNEVGCFVIDNNHEMELLQQVAEKKGKRVKALLRVAPGVSGHTHEYVTTGLIDSKFGFSVHGNAVTEAVKKIIDCKNIRFSGLHCHIGSQIFSTEAYREAVKVLIGLMDNIKQDFGVELEELNIGGGFGAYDIETDSYMNIQDFTTVIMKAAREQCDSMNFKLPKVIIEPGRWLVGETGITLYTIGSIKDIKGIRKYASIDGGMADNPRHILYQAAHQAVVANKAKEECTDTVTIAGRCCETGDILINDLRVPELEPGDILAVFGTGAYNYSMASNYNRLRKPAMVMVNNGNPRIVVKRQTYEDILRNESF